MDSRFIKNKTRNKTIHYYHNDPNAPRICMVRTVVAGSTPHKSSSQRVDYVNCRAALCKDGTEAALLFLLDTVRVASNSTPEYFPNELPPQPKKVGGVYLQAP